MIEDSIEIDASVEAVGRALKQAAEEWGGQWEVSADGGELWIPVSAGLRRGYWRGDVLFAPSPSSPGRIRLTAAAKDLELHVNRGGALILLVGAAGGIVAVLWPFFPALLEIGPMALVLAIAAWLLVSSNFRNSGLEEFLEAVDGIAESEPQVS